MTGNGHGRDRAEGQYDVQSDGLDEPLHAVLSIPLDVGPSVEVKGRVAGIPIQPSVTLITIMSASCDAEISIGTRSNQAHAGVYSSTRRNRKALPITDTELSVIAALAQIGLISRPRNGYKTPAATGTPIAL